jgi:mevalonate kinase
MANVTISSSKNLNGEVAATYGANAIIAAINANGKVRTVFNAIG